MKKRTLKNFLLPLILMFSSFIWIYTNTYAQEISWYTIVPELTEEESKEVDAAIEEIWSTPQEVMDNYREQLQEERKDIRAKFIRLVEFINSGEFYRLSDNHQQVLRNQKVVMEEYLDILNLRTYENMDSLIITDLRLVPLKYERC